MSDHDLRRDLKAMAPRVDDTGVWGGLQTKARRRRRTRIGVGSAVAALVVLGVVVVGMELRSNALVVIVSRTTSIGASAGGPAILAPPPSTVVTSVVDPSTWVTTQITQNHVMDEGPQISGDRIVWIQHDGHDYEIMAYDLKTGVTQRVTDNQVEDRSPLVSGDWVVWGSNMPQGAGSLQLENLVTHQSRELGSGSLGPGFQIAGNLVTWSSSSPGQANLYVHDIARDRTDVVASGRDWYQQWTDGRHVLFVEAQGQGSASSGRLSLYDSTTGDTEVLVAELQAPIADIRDSTIRALGSGKAAWSAVVDGHQQIFVRDLATKVTTQLTEDGGDNVEPEVGGDLVLWRRTASYDQAGPPSEMSTVMLRDLRTGSQVVLGQGFGRLSADGRLVVWSAWPQHFPDLHLYDVANKQVSTLALGAEDYDGTYPALDAGRVVFNRDRPGSPRPGTEIVVVQKRASP
jgi:hypothetical protein